MSKEIPQNIAVTFNPTLESKNPLISKALKFISENGIDNLPKEKVAILGDDIIFNGVVEADLRSPEKAALEAHKVYTDLQVIVKGTDSFGLKKTSDCKIEKTPYNPVKDVVFFSDDYAETVTVKAGQIIILEPSMAHAPCVGSGKVTKAVFKIKA